MDFYNQVDQITFCFYCYRQRWSCWRFSGLPALRYSVWFYVTVHFRQKMHCGSDVPRSSWLYKMLPWRKKGVLLSFCSVIINLMVLTWWVKFISAERYKYRYDTIHLSFVALDSFEWKEMKWRGTLDTIISYILVLFTQGPLFLNFLDLRLGTKKNYVCSTWWKTAVSMIKKVRNKLKLHPCKFSWRFGSTIRGYN